MLEKSFINDSDRIARRDYQPTDDDVIRARLRTLGVQEYKFIFDHGMFCRSPLISLTYFLAHPGRTMGQEWRLYDVGGARNTVRFVFKHLIYIHPKKINQPTPAIREEHGILTLMMVGNRGDRITKR